LLFLLTKQRQLTAHPDCYNVAAKENFTMRKRELQAREKSLAN